MAVPVWDIRVGNIYTLIILFLWEMIQLTICWGMSMHFHCKAGQIGNSAEKMTYTFGINLTFVQFSNSF